MHPKTITNIKKEKYQTQKIPRKHAWNNWKNGDTLHPKISRKRFITRIYKKQSKHLFDPKWNSKWAHGWKYLDSRHLLARADEVVEHEPKLSKINLVDSWE